MLCYLIGIYYYEKPTVQQSLHTWYPRSGGALHSRFAQLVTGDPQAPIQRVGRPSQWSLVWQVQSSRVVLGVS